MKKPPLLPAILALLGVIVLCGLGTWQIQRLHWKENLLAQMAAAEKTEPPLLSSAQIEAATPPARARVRGRWLPHQSIAVGPRTWQGTPGYHIVTPLKLHDGGIVLVNRGWTTERSMPEDAATDITGLLRQPEKPNMFVPQNNPATDNWFSIDPQQIAATKHLEQVAPFILYTDNETLRWSPPNDHLQYALFWFTMAGILLAVFWFRFIKA